MGICVARPCTPFAATEDELESSSLKTEPCSILTLPLFKDTSTVGSEAAQESLPAEKPFSDYDGQVWQHVLETQQQQNPKENVDAFQEQCSSSVAILQRISLLRSSSRTDKVSSLDDVTAASGKGMDKEEEATKGRSIKHISIGDRGRRLSQMLNNVYAQLTAIAPRRSSEPKQEYLKRVFALVDTSGCGKISQDQLARALHHYAGSRLSLAVMMQAADHNKDGFLSESEFISFFLRVESGDACLQADLNEAPPAAPQKSLTGDVLAIDTAKGKATPSLLSRSHPLRLEGGSRMGMGMRGLQVTNFQSQPSRIKCIALSPDGMLYAVAHCTDKVAHLYTMRDGAEVRRLSGHQGALLDVVFSTNKKHVVTAARDNFMVAWDRTVGLECSFVEHPGIVTAVALSYDGSYIFTGCQDNLVRKISVSKAKARAVLPHIPSEKPGVIVALAAQHTKNEIVSFSRSCDQCAYVCSASHLRLVAQLRGHQTLVWKTSFSADDNLLFTCCERRIILWNTTSFSSVVVFESFMYSPRTSPAVEALWTTATFASKEHASLLFCFNSVGQIHLFKCDETNKKASIMDMQLRSSVYAASDFVDNVMMCGDDFGNVYRVCIT